MILLCIVPIHIGIERSEEEAKAIDMSGMTTTRLPYTDYYLNSGKSGGKTIIANYTTFNLTLKSGKVLTTFIGNMRFN